MKKTKLLLGVILVFLFSFSSLVLKGQIPAAIDTKMKSDNMRNFQVEEIKVRWKKAALENCPGVPCVTGPGSSFTCGTSTIADIDGNSYNTVSIGTQCWLKENLRVTRFNDGSLIHLDNTGGPSGNVMESWSILATAAMTVYANDNPITGTNVGTFGYLYNWYAATDIRKICPDGWKIPNEIEWTTLIKYLDPAALSSGNPQSTIAGGAMKSTTLWASPNIGADNISKFTGLPAGGRGEWGDFISLGNNAYFWSFDSNVSNANFAWYRTLDNANSAITRNGFGNKRIGASLRCIKI